MKKYLLQLLQFGLKTQSKLTPGNDKLGHFYWGFFYSYVTNLFTNGILIIIVPLLFALSKELRDSTGLGNVEKLDVFFTILPGILLYTMHLCICIIKFNFT